MSIENPATLQKQSENLTQKRVGELADNLAEPKEKIEKVEEAMADLQVIMNIEDPEIQKQAMQVFIEKRLKELEKEVPEKQSTLSGLMKNL